VEISFGGFPPKEVFSRSSRVCVICVLKGVVFLERACGGPSSFEGGPFFHGRQL
jgi:hypothetical protein